MSQKEKLMQKLKNSKSLTFKETETLLKQLGFSKSDKGRTSGSRVAFISRENGVIIMHKPHPDNALREYQIKQLRDMLEKEGLI